ncbi:zinc metalloprotease HtpX [Halalkalicoccus subterraneus]|uniref:zinc metalloprotease HtpX n=1 Tax=Halalkalicoccus subterraneus TaxID=2675002 RepID=UPI000EFC99A0|nr:zinc metalloprotease HtpX [Halalkalicoccus subterraneus]
MDWHTQWGLRLRMGGVMILFIALYIGFIGVLSLYFSSISAIALGILIVSTAQLLYGYKVPLKAMGGTVVTATEYPELHQRITRLSQQAGLPQPAVAVAPTDLPNAFAAGRSRNTAVVCVTTGLLENLDGDELDAVLAHELAHIQNRDMVIMTAASALSATAFYIVRWGWVFDDGGGGDGGEGMTMMVAVIASFVVWILSFFITRLLSRYREYTADQGAVSITGKPTALATALRTISATTQDMPNEDLREHAGMNAMFFDDIDTTDRFTRWCKTHPAVDDRIERLRDLERELAIE